MPYKLIVADQSVTIRRALELTFRGTEVEILPVDGRQELEALLRTTRPEVLVLDLAFLGKDFEVEYAAISPVIERLATYTILMARLDDEISIEKIRKFGIKDFILKPLDNQELRSKVLAYLESRAAGEAGEPEDAGRSPAAREADTGSLAEELAQRLVPILSDYGAAGELGGGEGLIQEFTDRLEVVQGNILDALESQVSLATSRSQSNLLGTVLQEVRSAFVEAIEGITAGREADAPAGEGGADGATAAALAQIQAGLEELLERRLDGLSGELAELRAGLAVDRGAGEAGGPATGSAAEAFTGLIESLERRLGERLDAGLAELHRKIEAERPEPAPGGPAPAISAELAGLEERLAERLGSGPELRLSEKLATGLAAVETALAAARAPATMEAISDLVTDLERRLGLKLESGLTDLRNELRVELAAPAAEHGAASSQLEQAVDSLPERFSSQLAASEHRLLATVGAALDQLPARLATDLDTLLAERLPAAPATPAEAGAAGPDPADRLAAVVEQAMEAAAGRLAESSQAVAAELATGLRERLEDMLSERLPPLREAIKADLAEARQALSTELAAGAGQLPGQLVPALQAAIQESAAGLAERIEAAQTEMAARIAGALPQELGEKLGEMVTPEVVAVAQATLARDAAQGWQDLRELHAAELASVAAGIVDTLGQEMRTEMAARTRDAVAETGPAVLESLQEHFAEVLRQITGPHGENLAGQFSQRLISAMDLPALARRVEEAVSQAVLKTVPEVAIPLIQQAIDRITEADGEAVGSTGPGV